MTEAMDANGFIALTVKKGLAKTAVKYDNVDLEPATGRGIPVSSTSGVLSDGTADQAQVMIFLLSRCILTTDKLTRPGRFNARAPMRLLGGEITAKMLDIRQEAEKKGVMAVEELRTMLRGERAPKCVNPEVSDIDFRG